MGLTRPCGRRGGSPAGRVTARPPLPPAGDPAGAAPAAQHGGAVPAADVCGPAAAPHAADGRAPAAAPQQRPAPEPGGCAAGERGRGGGRAAGERGRGARGAGGAGGAGPVSVPPPPRAFSECTLTEVLCASTRVTVLGRMRTESERGSAPGPGSQGPARAMVGLPAQPAPGGRAGRTPPHGTTPHTMERGRGGVRKTRPLPT